MLLKILSLAAAFLMILFAVRSRIAPFLPKQARAAMDARVERATNSLMIAGAIAALLIVGFLLFLHWLDRA